MDVKAIGERIYDRRTQLNMTLDDVAKKVGVARSTIQRYEKGLITRPKRAVLSEIARALEQSADWLTGGAPGSAGRPWTPSRIIPVLGKINAGFPLYAEQNPDGYTVIDREDEADYFALRVEGDSMNAVNIHDGNLLIVRRQDWVKDGDIAVVMVGDGEATVKKFYRTGNRVMLVPQSTNPNHQIQIYDLDQTPVRILGRVVENKISFE